MFCFMEDGRQLYLATILPALLSGDDLAVFVLSSAGL